jgi:hypothetical protein
LFSGAVRLRIKKLANQSATDDLTSLVSSDIGPFLFSAPSAESTQAIVILLGQDAMSADECSAPQRCTVVRQPKAGQKTGGDYVNWFMAVVPHLMSRCCVLTQ